MIFVEDPNSKTSKRFSWSHDRDETLLTDVMNGLMFDPEHGTEFDANFMSILKPNLEEFVYYVQRLVGVVV